MCGIQILLICIFKNYYCYVIVIPCITFLTNIVNLCYANKLFPNIICKGSIDSNRKKDIGKRVLGLSIIKISAASRNALDSIIVSAFLGLNIVAIYNNYFYILHAVSSILLVFTSSIAAGVGNTVATQSKEQNLARMRHLNFMNMLLTGLCAVMMLNIYQPFMKLWVGEEMMFSELIVIMFVLYFYMGQMGNIIVQYFDAAGLWWKGKWRGVIETILNLTLNLLLGYYFGVEGILLATIISAGIVSIPLLFFYTFKHYFMLSAKSYLLDHLLLFLIMLIIGVVSYLVCNLIILPETFLFGILTMIIRTIITSLVFLFSILVLWKYPLFIETRNFIFTQLKIKKR